MIILPHCCYMRGRLDSSLNSSLNRSLDRRLDRSRRWNYRPNLSGNTHKVGPVWIYWLGWSSLDRGNEDRRG